LPPPCMARVMDKQNAPSGGRVKEGESDAKG